jgi:hypothetical protein
MPYTDYPNPNATLNHRTSNVELSHVAAIAEDTLRNRAREYSKQGGETQNSHDDIQEGAEDDFARAEKAYQDAERIGHMILAREMPEKY